MAIYHLSSQIIGRSGGKSSVASAAYRSGEKIQDEHIGETFDYTRKTGVDYKEILAPDRSPAWVQNRGQLWNQVEKVERRKDAQLARELNIALPKELSREQQIELVRNFTKEQFVNKGMVADLTMHHLDGENPHAHVMLTTREIGPEGFGKKNREWNDRELLKEWRKEWANYTNKALEKAGSQERIDHRTLKDQGINRLPQQHIGPHAAAMEKRGIRTERGDQNRKIIDFNEAKKRLRIEANELNNDIEKYKAEVIQLETQKKEQPKQPAAPISEPAQKKTFDVVTVARELEAHRADFVKATIQAERKRQQPYMEDTSYKQRVFQIQDCVTRIQEQTESIIRMQEKRNGLGLFKVREKKALATQIAKMQEAKEAQFDKLKLLGVADPSQAQSEIEKNRQLATQETAKAKAINEEMKTGAREAKNAYLAIAKEIPEDKRVAVKEEQERVREPLSEKGMTVYSAEIKAKQELDKAVTGKDREKTHQRSTEHER